METRSHKFYFEQNERHLLFSFQNITKLVLLACLPGSSHFAKFLHL